MEIIAIILLAMLTVLLFTTLFNVLLWERVENINYETKDSVSVLIPARNESANIIGCLECLINQTNVKEILVYNDYSSDDTAEKVISFSKQYPVVQLIEPSTLPSGWTGKTFACYQLAQKARGDWLLFIDADTRITHNAISGMLLKAQQWNVTFLSCWPGLEMVTFWERFLMPVLNFFVYTVYPAFLSFKFNMPSLGIAHGACIMIKRDVYHKIGGHERVKNKIFEDTELARLWRNENERSLCFDGQNVVRVRMYESLKDIWIGFQKNFYPGFNSEVSFWIFMAFHALLFLIPFFLFFISLYIVLMVILVLTIRILLSIRFRHPFWSALLHPFGEIFLLALGISSWWKFTNGPGVNWKGRTYAKGSFVSSDKAGQK